MKRRKQHPAGRRAAMKAGRNAALALACAAAVGLPAAHAQGGHAEEPPLPELVYDTYFEPFTDNPLYRIHYPEPIQPVAPLFQKYDPLEGLSREAKVSRVSLPGERYVAYLPLVEGTVGQEISLPVSLRSAPSPTTSIRIFLDYDPAIATPVGSSGVGIPSEDIFMNPHPDPSYTGDCTNCLIAYNVLTYPWSGTGPMLNIKFRLLSPGESKLSVVFVEVGDDTLHLRSTVFQDGLLRVNPRER